MTLSPDENTLPMPASTPARPDETTAPWARPEPTGMTHATTRTRRYVESLPDWEPLPPGEINVRRRRD